MAKKSEIDGMTLRPASGGVVSETTTKTKRSGQGGGPSHEYETETAVHPSAEHLMGHIQKHMGDCFGDGHEESKDE